MPLDQRMCKLWIEGSPAAPLVKLRHRWRACTCGWWDGLGLFFPELVIWSLKLKSGWFGIVGLVLGKRMPSVGTCALGEREPSWWSRPAWQAGAGSYGSICPAWCFPLWNTRLTGLLPWLSKARVIIMVQHKCRRHTLRSNWYWSLHYEKQSCWK